VELIDFICLIPTSNVKRNGGFEPCNTCSVQIRHDIEISTLIALQIIQTFPIFGTFCPGPATQNTFRQEAVYIYMFITWICFEGLPDYSLIGDFSQMIFCSSSSKHICMSFYLHFYLQLSFSLKGL
jgi:hypothetical protein